MPMKFFTETKKADRRFTGTKNGNKSFYKD